MNTPRTPDEVREITRLTNEVKDDYQSAHSDAVKARQLILGANTNAIQCGEKLIRLKELVGRHGQWQKFLKIEFGIEFAHEDGRTSHKGGAYSYSSLTSFMKQARDQKVLKAPELGALDVQQLPTASECRALGVVAQPVKKPAAAKVEPVLYEVLLKAFEKLESLLTWGAITALTPEQIGEVKRRSLSIADLIGDYSIGINQPQVIDVLLDGNEVGIDPESVVIAKAERFDDFPSAPMIAAEQ